MLPTAGLYWMNWDRVAPLDVAIDSQLSSATTRWNLLQSVIMPGWMGAGTVIPFIGPVDVVVVVVFVKGLMSRSERLFS